MICDITLVEEWLVCPFNLKETYICKCRHSLYNIRYYLLSDPKKRALLCSHLIHWIDNNQVLPSSRMDVMCLAKSLHHTTIGRPRHLSSSLYKATSNWPLVGSAPGGAFPLPGDFWSVSTGAWDVQIGYRHLQSLQTKPATWAEKQWRGWSSRLTHGTVRPSKSGSLSCKTKWKPCNKNLI